MEVKYLVHLGTFKNKTGRFIVADPCYLSTSYRSSDVLKVKKGVWKAAIVTTTCKDWGYRIGCLLVYHESYMNPGKNPVKEISLEDLWSIQWHPDDVGTGVDSGQAGFFSSCPAKKNLESHYEDCCQVTVDGIRSGAGIVSNGVVSSSGTGDGSYPCYSRHNGKGETEIAVLDYLNLVPIMKERKRLIRIFKKGEIALHLHDIEHDENKEYVECLLKNSKG